MVTQDNIQNFFIGIFASILIVPSVLFLVLKKEGKTKENRILAEAPDFAFNKTYSQEFEAYYNDHFPFRNYVIKLNSLLKSEVFKVSVNPSKVQYGKDGFLFLNTKDAYNSYVHKETLGEKELNRFADSIVRRKKALADKGIAYYYGYFPNKHEIYSEFMNDAMHDGILDRMSLAEQIERALDKRGIAFFNPKENLLKLKDSVDLYLKLDSHWNNTGAYHTYVHFFETYPEIGIEPLRQNQFNIRYVHQRFGDLTRLLGVDSISGYHEKRPLYELRNKSIMFTKEDVSNLPPLAIRNTNENGINKRILFFGDSYSHPLSEFFSYHFKEAIFLRDEYNQEMVDELKPDIVVELSVERFLHNDL
ncbi:alginate O-acetyltransferase AlgX-related protein [Luteirhabdus pelagi]|uniref:alginate O-acetyltransferase AlgX-related protein n=1 Tax=Luteirhabdus pelagi TaxID=2792783 RepID=UPI00193A862A|nr:hypothetical protein [Luteirhabdus pelagi]